MNRSPLSNVTIDSVLRHQEVGRAKDLQRPPSYKVGDKRQNKQINLIPELEREEVLDTSTLTWTFL